MVRGCPHMLVRSAVERGRLRPLAVEERHCNNRLSGSRCSVDVQVPLLCGSEAAALGGTTTVEGSSCGGPVVRASSDQQQRLKCRYFERCGENGSSGPFIVRGVCRMAFKCLDAFFYDGILHYCVVALTSKVLSIGPAAFQPQIQLHSTTPLSLRALLYRVKTQLLSSIV